MKFKSHPFAYYGVIMLQVSILALWIGLLFLIPIRNEDDFTGFIISLLAVELLLFSCSPIAHRTVAIDDHFITEKWLCFAFNRIELSEISDIGVCTHLAGNQVRQFAFVSTDKLSDEDVIKWDDMGMIQRKKHNGSFISIDHPQKGLDECMKTIADKITLHYRKISA